MDDSMKRLYRAAKDLRNVEGQTNVANLLGQTPQTVKNWETRGISKQGAIAAEGAIGTRVNWVLHGTGPMLVEGGAQDGSTDESNVYEIHPRKRVPIISWVIAGNLEDIEDHHQPGEADEWVEVYDTLPGENAFALRVKNDSMTSPHPGERSFPEGTVIVVDPLRGCDAGDFVVAKDVVTQQATFKKLTTDGGRWFLKPLNPIYPTVEIDDPALRVIGRVIEAVTRQKL